MGAGESMIYTTNAAVNMRMNFTDIVFGRENKMIVPIFLNHASANSGVRGHGQRSMEFDSRWTLLWAPED